MQALKKYVKSVTLTDSLLRYISAYFRKYHDNKIYCTLNPNDTHVTHDVNHVHVAYDAQYDNNAFGVDDAHDT